MKKLILLLSVLVISCNSEKQSKPDTEYSWWGEDIVYNESSQDLDLILYYNQKEYPFNIQSGKTITLYHPNYDFHICITDVSDSLKVIFADGTTIKAKKGDKLIYQEYSKEEIDYWVTIDGEKYLEEEKYPVYHYKINTPDKK